MSNNLDIKKIKSLFTEFHKRFWYVSKYDSAIFIFISVINAALETLALFLIWPLIAIFINKQSAATSIFGKFLSKYTFFDPSHAVVFAGLAVGGVYLLKNAVMLASNLREVHVLARWKSLISNHIYTGCLYAPLEFHNRRGNNNISDIVLCTIPYVVNQFISQLFQLLSNIVLCFTVVAILTYLVSPVFFLVILFGGFLLILSHKTFKHFHKYVGKKTIDSSNQVLNILVDTFLSYRDMHVYQMAKVFKSEFIKRNNEFIKTEKWGRFLDQAPGMLNEVIFVNVMILCMYIMATFQTDKSSAAQQLGILVVTFFRFIPALNRISTSLIMMRGACEHMQNLLDTVDELEEIKQKNMAITDDPSTAAIQEVADEPLISIQNANFSYGITGRPSVVDISLNIKHGSMVVLVGPSGGGKSTLLNAMMGFLHPSAGHIKVYGQKMQDVLPAWWQRVAIVMQNFYILNSSIAENIAFGKTLDEIDMQKVEKTLQDTDMAEFVNTLPDGVLSSVGYNGKLLSEGQRQRLAICRALYFNKDIWILDEVTSALDLKTETVILNLLKSFSGKVTIIMAAHRPSVFKYADYVVFVKGGSLVAHGAPQDLVNHSVDFRELVKESQNYEFDLAIS